MNEVSLADIAAVTDRNGYCNGWGNNGMFGMEWIFALLILPMLWGGNGPFGRGGYGGNPVDEAGLCNAMNFNNLENAVGRLNDTVQQNARTTDNAICTLGYQGAQLANETQRQLADCCCTTQRMIDQVNYNGAMNTASINAVTTAQTQKILDAICGNRMADMQNQINQLQLHQAVAGVVRYPTTFAYNAGLSPFCGGCGCGCGCGSNNI